MIKVTINIEADSIEEAKSAMAQLGGGSAESPETMIRQLMADGGVTVQADKPAATRKRATAPAIVAADPLAGATPSGVDPANPQPDPLGAAPVVAADPLGATPAATGSVPPQDPLGATPAAAPVAKPTGEITLQMIREKIGNMTEKKQAAKDAIATFLKVDGTPCEKPSDIQEADFAKVYEKLDWL